MRFILDGKELEGIRGNIVWENGIPALKEDKNGTHVVADGYPIIKVEYVKIVE